MLGVVARNHAYAIGLSLIEKARGDTLNVRANNPSWLHLRDAPPTDAQARLTALVPILQELSRHAVSRRRGQCLELGAQSDAHCVSRFSDFGRSVSEFENRSRPETRTIERRLPIRTGGSSVRLSDGGVNASWLLANCQVKVWQWVSLKIIEGALGKAGRPPRECVGRDAVSEWPPFSSVSPFLPACHAFRIKTY